MSESSISNPSLGSWRGVTEKFLRKLISGVSGPMRTFDLWTTYPKVVRKVGLRFPSYDHFHVMQRSGVLKCT